MAKHRAVFIVFNHFTGYDANTNRPVLANPGASGQLYSLGQLADSATDMGIHAAYQSARAYASFLNGVIHVPGPDSFFVLEYALSSDAHDIYKTWPGARIGPVPAFDAEGHDLKSWSIPMYDMSDGGFFSPADDLLSPPKPMFGEAV